MSTFQVDTMAIQAGLKQLRQVITALTDMLPQFQELTNLASATGDAGCAQAFTGFIGQWSYELASITHAVTNFHNNLLSASNEYVFTEGAISDTEVYTYDLESL